MRIGPLPIPQPQELPQLLDASRVGKADTGIATASRTNAATNRGANEQALGNIIFESMIYLSAVPGAT